MIDQQDVIGGLLNGARDALTVLRAKKEDSQNEHVERALQERELFAVAGASGFHLTQA